MNFHGEERLNRTYDSKTDPEAKIARKGKGKEANLSYSGNLLLENRNGLILNAMVWDASGTAEFFGQALSGSAACTPPVCVRDTAFVMLEQIPGKPRVTVGEDKGFETADFFAECRHMQVSPHVAQNNARPGASAIDRRTTRQEGYRISQRKRIEECLGWLKTIALLRKVRHRGLFKVDWMFTFACAVYNLVRPRNLSPQTAGTVAEVY